MKFERSTGLLLRIRRDFSLGFICVASCCFVLFRGSSLQIEYIRSIYFSNKPIARQSEFYICSYR